MAYSYSPAETVADGLVHMAGLGLAIPASAILLMQAADRPETFTATALYVGFMLFSFAASAIYHLSPVDRVRPILHRIVLAGEQMLQLQRKLAARGYDVGEIDGILGAGTRDAVRDVQRELGMPADAWPTPELLSRL